MPFRLATRSGRCRAPQPADPLSGPVEGIAVEGLLPGQRGPALIAHGAGNAADRARAAIQEHADLVEVDLWVHSGRFEARHERAVYPVPLLYEKWYIKWARRGFDLLQLIEVVGAEMPLFLDLKNGDHAAAVLLREAAERLPSDFRFLISSQHWPLLRRLMEEFPAMEPFYSIDVQSKLDLFISVSGRDKRPRGVSCRHQLLTETIVQRLHDNGLLVIAWTVDDPAQAIRLASWGVDGITTHRVLDLREALLGLL